MKYESTEFSPVERSQISNYASASGDFNRIHLDEDFAKAAGLPAVIAHGMLVMGLAASALERWGFNRQKVKFFETKFKDKVFPGDKLIAEFIKIQEDAGPNKDARQVFWCLVKSTGEEVLTAEALLK